MKQVNLKELKGSGRSGKIFSDCSYPRGENGMYRLSSGLAAVVIVMVAGYNPGTSFAQTPQEIDGVRKAMKAAYIRESAVEPCAPVSADRFGWSKDVVVRCLYVQQDKLPNGQKVDRKAVAEAIFPEPSVIARWITTACAVLKTQSPNCFSRVVAEGKSTSGFQFVITGNVLEDLPPTGRQKNFFFRNGMTVSVERGVNGTTQDLSLDRQRTLADTSNETIVSIPSGRTRYWSTMPSDFRARFPNAGAPTNVSTPERRLAWLDLARREFSSALTSDRNRLLEAWLCANASKKFATACKAPPPSE
ncbi:MAG: hypothetical protein ACREU8_06230 [Gammaproteobacteria bacterium]